MLIVRAIFLLILVLIYPSISYSQHDLVQQTVPDINNIYYTISEGEAKAMYSSKFFDSFGYLDGKQYKSYFTFGHTPPLLEGDRGVGTIFSNGKSYTDLILLYDINLDVLINIPKRVSYGNLYININKASIDSFRIEINSNTYNLKHLHFPKNINTPMQDGFYEVYYFGKTQFLIRHRAVASELHGYTEYKYAPLNYIFKKENYYRINSKGNFLKLFPDNRKIINKKIKSYQTSYRSLRKSQIIDILQFAESL